MSEVQGIGYSDIKKYLHNIDYVATALTPWHAFSLVGAIKEMERKVNRHLRGLVLMVKNPGEEFLIDENHFSMIEATCVYFSAYRTKLQMIKMEIDTTSYALFKCGKTKDEKLPFFVFGHNRPALYNMAYIDRLISSSRTIVSITCDEGIGSYVDTGKERIQQFRYGGASKFKMIRHYYEEYLIAPRASIKLKNSNRALELCLFSINKNNELILSKNIADYTAQAIKQYSEYISYEPPNIKGDYVIINTQLFVGGEITSIDEIDKLWKNIIDLYLARNIDVWLKPHPREKNIKKYKDMGAKLICSKGIAQEVLLMKMKKPLYVISIYSTTLVTAPLINHVPSISITRMIDNMDCSTEIFRTYSRRFCNLFKNYTRFVSSLSELK